MSNPSDMTIAARVSAELFFRLEREAARKGVKVGDYAGQILSGQHQNRVASQAPSCEDVRLMIREEIREALREAHYGGAEWSAEEIATMQRQRTSLDGSHKAPLGLWKD